jgi:hypothetical protein
MLKCSLYIWEAHACLCRLDSCITNKGEEKYPIHVYRGSFASRDEKFGEMHLFRGSLHSCIWELFFAWILVVLFCRWYRALLPHLEESAILEHFISVVSSRCPCLRGPRFFSPKWPFLGYCLAFDDLFEFFHSFLFFFSFLLIGYLFVLSMHSSRGRLRTSASEDRWMVAPGCDEWLTTWCGVTLGRVLQVQVVAWFALVQVKSERERSMPCGASEEWRDTWAQLEGLGGQWGSMQAAWCQEKQDEVMERSRCRVAVHDWSLHAGFAVHHRTVRLLCWATKPRPEARGRRRDPGAPRSFDAGGHVVGSQGLRRENADYGDGVAV